MLARNKYLLLLVTTIISACAMFKKDSKQLPINGSFKVKLDTGVAYNKEITSFPVSAQFVDDTPFINNTIINKGLPLFGLYTNNGFSCSILWTTITFSDGTTLNNAKGVAKSSCQSRIPIKDSDMVTAKWN